MKKKGVVSIFTIMFITLMLILILNLAPVLLEFNEVATGGTSNNSSSTAGYIPAGLDCDNINGSVFSQNQNGSRIRVCMVTQSLVPLYVGAIIGFLGVILAARLILN